MHLQISMLQSVQRTFHDIIRVTEPGTQEMRFQGLCVTVHGLSGRLVHLAVYSAARCDFAARCTSFIRCLEGVLLCSMLVELKNWILAQVLCQVWWCSQSHAAQLSQKAPVIVLIRACPESLGKLEQHETRSTHLIAVDIYSACV